MSVTLEQAVDREKTAEELLGELAHHLSLLIERLLEAMRQGGRTNDPSALPRRQGLPRDFRSKCIRLTSTAITVTR
jgi:hypothetical protein